MVPGVAILDRRPDQSPGVRPISPSHYELREIRRGGPPGWSTDQVRPGVHTLEWIFFPDLSPRAKPYCGVKCSQGLHFPATHFIWKPDSSFTSPEPNEGMKPSQV